MNAKAAVKDLVLPFKILISPFKTFSQLAQSPSLIGLASELALISVFTATMAYAFASKIVLNINGSTSFLATDLFGSWYTSNFVSALFYILVYWLVFASGLALISKLVGGKETSWSALFVTFGYLLSVVMILYAVRTVMYLALPSIEFGISYWPPAEMSPEGDAASNLIVQRWGTQFAYQFLTSPLPPLVAFIWLVFLGAIAVRALREVSWQKSLVVSVIGFFITLFLFGPP